MVSSWHSFMKVLLVCNVQAFCCIYSMLPSGFLVQVLILSGFFKNKACSGLAYYSSLFHTCEKLPRQILRKAFKNWVSTVETIA